MSAEPTNGVEARASTALDRLAGGLPALGLALSGGGDSTALLLLAQDWAAARKVTLAAVTIDHGLRPESAAEAAGAAAAAAALGIAHRVIRWDGPAATGNLAAQAREARLALIGDWARGAGLGTVALGHTRDDVAETLLMRLGRGAGLDGLAAMAEQREAEGMVWLRPLLGVGRAELRAFLTMRGVAWADDPTNDDLRHDRARVRAAMAAANLDPARLADSAAHLAAAREALQAVAAQAMAEAQMDGADLILPRAAFDAAPREVRRIILLAALGVVAGATYPPRRDTLIQALEAVAEGRRSSLGGALLRPTRRTLAITREPAAAARAAPLLADGIWDSRWRIAGLPPEGAIRAWPFTAKPALWCEGAAVAVLPAMGCTATPVAEPADFRRKLGMQGGQRTGTH